MTDASKPPEDSAKRKAPQDTGLVQSLTRALELLEILATSTDGLRLKQISSNAGLSPSTAHRLLTTMEQKRFVKFDREGCLWSIGSNCFSIGSGYVRRSIVTEALPHLQALSERVRDTVSIGVRDENRLLLLRQVPSRARMPSVPLLRPGSRLPIHASALGKVVLSASRNERHAAIAPDGVLPKVTSRTIVRLPQLQQELDNIRSRGFAIDDEESGFDKRCIAAPIFDELGQCIAAISICGTKERLADSLLPKLSAITAQTAGDITRALGGASPQGWV